MYIIKTKTYMDKKTKICKECGKELSIENFNKNSAMKDGYVNICKDCQREQRRKRLNQEITPAIQTGTMVCPVCGRELPVEAFPVYGKSKTGRDWLCKECRDYHSSLNVPKDKNYFKKLRIKVSKEYRQEQYAIDRKSRIKNFARAMYTAAKNRAARRGIDFNLDLEDIIIPEKCPILQCPFEYGTSKNYSYSPSLDRIDNSKGYIKVNVRVISSKANSMKNSATWEELELFCKNILRYSPNYSKEIDLENKESLG